MCLLRTIKGLRFYPFFQANKLAYSSFVGAGRRHNTLNTEKKDVITISTSSSHSVIVLSLVSQAPAPMGRCKVTLSAPAVGCIKGDKP